MRRTIFHFQSKQALVTLTAMIVMGFMSLAVTSFVILSSIDLLQQGQFDTEYQETFVGADACAEEALFGLNNDVTYSGEDFTIGSVDCHVTVTTNGLGFKVVNVEATQGGIYISTLELTVNVATSPITLTNWEEVL